MRIILLTLLVVILFAVLLIPARAQEGKPNGGWQVTPTVAEPAPYPVYVEPAPYPSPDGGIWQTIMMYLPFIVRR